MKYLSIFIAILLISVNVLASNLSSLSGAISKTKSVKQTKDVLDSKKKCFNKVVICKEGFNVSTDKLSCEMKMCAVGKNKNKKQKYSKVSNKKIKSSIVSKSIKKAELSYNKKNKCYEPKVKCDAGFVLKVNKCEIKMCSNASKVFANKITTNSVDNLFYKKSGKCYEKKVTCDIGTKFVENKCKKILCKLKPSVSNSSKTKKDVFYKDGNCFVAKLATECVAGHELKNKDTDKAFCEKKVVKLCTKQPSLKNSTKTISNFTYEAKNCMIKELPVECEKGYSISKPKTQNTDCSRISKGVRRN